MWIGSVGQTKAMVSMTEERALELCGPNTIEDDPVDWSEKDFDYERRRVIRSVRHISEESGVIDAPHLILVDDLASWLGSGSPPSPSVMAEGLRRADYRAAVAHYGKPAFRTDAPWDDIVRISREVHPPM
jgi:tRNA G26 N,N-dimethylase Trm1